MSCTKLLGPHPEFNLACSHRWYHPYEKSVDYAYVSAMVFCVAFKLLGSSICGRLFRRRLPSLFLHPLGGFGWLERGNHLFALGRIQGAAPKVVHSHARPFSGQCLLGLTNRRELTQTHLETFHPFTQLNTLGRNRKIPGRKHETKDYSNRFGMREFCPAPVQPRTANDLQALLRCHVCSIRHEHSRGFGLSSNRFDNRPGFEDVTHCASSSATLESPRHCSYRWSAEHALRNCDCSLPICPLDRRLVEPHICCDRRSCSYRYTGRSGRASHGW